VVSTNIVELSLLDEGPDVRLLQVVDLVLVRSSKVGAHAAVVASNDHTALAGGLFVVDAVLGVNAGLFAGLLKEVGILVTADTANVESRVFGEDVL
jgi:hypothetical protein